MQFWPQQQDLYQRAREAFRGRRTVLIQSPTGSGKTVLIAIMAKSAAGKGLNVWVLVPRNELLEQASETLLENGVPHGMIKPGAMESRAYDVHVVSKDTLIRRYDEIKRAPDFIIVDEAHLALDRYMEIADVYPDAKIAGFTATPERLDGRGLSELYEVLVMGPTMPELVKAGRLSNMRYFCPPIDGLDDIKRSGTEYNIDDLDRLLKARKVYGEAITHYRRHADHKPCLVYCRSVQAASETAQRFNDAGYRFENIDGNMGYKVRRSLINSLRDGKIDGLASCELIIYGLDVPRVECVIMLNPTFSRTRFFQMVGRGLRAYPGKRELIVLDHVGNLQEHGHPFSPYEWKFNGTARRTRKDRDPTIIARLCPAIDYMYCDKPSCVGCPHSKGGKDPRPVITVDADLVEADSPIPLVDRDPAEQEIIEDCIQRAVSEFKTSEKLGLVLKAPVKDLLEVAASIGRKPIWVYWVLANKQKELNGELLKEIAHQKKFKPGWVFFTGKQIEGQLAGRK